MLWQKQLHPIEMQMMAGPDFQKRILYYWAVLHSGQLLEGEDYYELRETISICFVNNVLYPKVPDYHQEFRLLSSKDPGTQFTDQLSIHLLELSKFSKRAEELTEPMEAWCYFLANGKSLDADNLPQTLLFLEVQKAMEKLRSLTQNEIERQRYLDRLQAQFDHNTMVRMSTKGVEQALKQGLEQGLEQGRAKALVHLIRAYQQLLKQPLTPEGELLALDLVELQERVNLLERQLGINVEEHS